MSHADTDPSITAAARSHPRADVIRWQVGYGTFGVPQAAAPIAFALLALPLTGSAESGAWMVFAMTLAQVIGAVPISRLGSRMNAVTFLRILIAVRTLALLAVAGLAAVQAPFAWLVGAAAAAGLVNGAAYGYQRLLLNHLVAPARLPRALGVAATLNEVTFATAPVLASLLGAVSPVGAMALVAALGIGPILLMPRISDARQPAPEHADEPATRLPFAVYVWLLCAAASGAVVAGIEVGAVSFALRFGFAPGWAALFALTLCCGSIAGGVWVSIRNRGPRTWQVLAFLAATTAASAVVLTVDRLFLALAAILVVGFFLPFLGTFYSLALDRLAPAHRRAEVFALLRTASSIGVIAVSGLLALAGLSAALVGGFVLLLAAFVLAAAHHRPRARAAAPR